MGHPFLPTFNTTSDLAFSFSKKIKTSRKELSDSIPFLLASEGPPFLLPQFPTQLQYYLLSDAFQHSCRQNWLSHLLYAGNPFFPLHGTELSSISVCLCIPSNQYRIWYAINMTSCSYPSQKPGIHLQGSHSSSFLQLILHKGLSVKAKKTY